MSVKEVTEYKCDVCGRVYPVERTPLKIGQRPLREIPVPSRNYDCEGRNFSKGIAKVDMCEQCFENYWEYIQERYGVDDCYGISVKMKGGAE